MTAPLPPLLLRGDCLVELARIPDGSVDSVVTDPPYGLEFMGKGWDGADGFRRSLNPADTGRDSVFGRTSRTSPEYRAGHLFEEWTAKWAAECYRILKPGGHLLAFGGSRTWHRLAAGIEDAGFEIRDSIAWLQGAGFPKSHNVSRALDGSRCGCPVQYNHASDVRGVRVDVQSPTEPSSQGRESDVLASVQWKGEGSRTNEARTQGARSLDSDERSVVSREDDGRPQPGMEGWRDVQEAEGELRRPEVRTVPRGPARNVEGGRVHHGAPPRDGKARATAVDADGVRESHRPQSTEQRSGEPRTLADQRGPQARGSWPICERCGKPMVPDGLGTALKPAFEPVVVARKPLGERTVAANVLAHGTGALNIDATRIESERPTGWSGGGSALYEGGLSREGGEARPTTSGRWPANVALDESQAAALDEQSGTLKGAVSNGRRAGNGAMFDPGEQQQQPGYGDTGGASRFFYVAKAPKSERPVVDGTAHPTVKPLALMRWLCRLVTPPGGIVVDPFAGSGTTLEAAYLEGFESIGVEMTPEYWPLIAARIERVTR